MFLVTRPPSLRAHARPQGPRSQRGTAKLQALPSPAATAPGTHWAEATPSRTQWDALAPALVTPVDAPAGGPVLATQALGDAPSLLVVVRSMGCPFCQELASALARDVVAPLTDAGVTLKLGERVGVWIETEERQSMEGKKESVSFRHRFFSDAPPNTHTTVSIGTPERGLEFCDLTGFPSRHLLADPDALVYEALGLERGPVAAFLSPTTPLAIGRRVAGGGGSSLAAALSKWKPYKPPRGTGQALHQGGAFAFEAGGQCVWARCDRATADHAEPSELLRRGLALV